MLLDPAKPAFQLADQDTMADHARVVFYDSSTEPDDLFAVLLPHGQEVRRHVGAQQMHVALQFAPQRFDVAFRDAPVTNQREIGLHVRNLGAHVAQELYTKLSGSATIFEFPSEKEDYDHAASLTSRTV